jgi:ABC-2 type transport system permease protein
MISSLIRFPLIFISGIFVPVSRMPEWSRSIAYISPLTYFTDVARYSFGLQTALPIYVDFLALACFSVAFFVLSVILHKKATYSRL